MLSLARPQRLARDAICGQAVFILPAGDGGSDHGGAVPVADIVLNDKYRPDSPLLRPNHRAEICVKHFTSVHFHNKTSLLILQCVLFTV